MYVQWSAPVVGPGVSRLTNLYEGLEAGAREAGVATFSVSVLDSSTREKVCAQRRGASAEAHLEMGVAALTIGCRQDGEWGVGVCVGVCLQGACSDCHQPAPPPPTSSPPLTSSCETPRSRVTKRPFRQRHPAGRHGRAPYPGPRRDRCRGGSRPQDRARVPTAAGQLEGGPSLLATQRQGPAASGVSARYHGGCMCL